MYQVGRSLSRLLVVLGWTVSGSAIDAGDRDMREEAVACE